MEIIADLGFALGVAGIEGNDRIDVLLDAMLIDVVVIIGGIHGGSLDGQLGVFFGGLFQQRDGLGVVGGISRSHNDFQGELRLDVHDEVDFVSEEAVSFGLMSPPGILVGIGFQAVAFSFTGADFDAELVGESPDVSGVNCGVDEVFDQADSNGLCDEAVEDFLEGFCSQAFSEVGEGGMRGGLEEVKATEGLESNIEGEAFGKVSFGVGFSEVDQKDGFVHRDRGEGRGSCV